MSQPTMRETNDAIGCIGCLGVIGVCIVLYGLVNLYFWLTVWRFN